MISACAMSATLRPWAIAVRRSARVGLLLADALGLHQHALGAVDDLALLQRRLGRGEFGAQPGDDVEAGDRRLSTGRMRSRLSPPTT